MTKYVNPVFLFLAIRQGSEWGTDKQSLPGQPAV